ncbi:hypothetical protein HYV82_03875 [Candidatus Woesearchaeota archaeon]|nr:hypothetical protein [Candidatus Woesearchaeota archaeon]
MDIVGAGVDLQERVFKEKGVSQPEKRVLLYNDSVGRPESPGILDGSSPGYCHIYMLYNGQLVGMRISEVTKVKGLKPPVVLDYVPALVPEEHLDARYPVTDIVDILMRFDLHVMGATQCPSYLMPRFTDGIGLSEEQLRRNGYFVSLAKISVPPLDAQTREEYNSVLDRVPFYVFPAGISTGPVISRTSADRLFVGKYLKEGYLDYAVVRKAGLRVNELPCVVQTRQELASVAIVHGHIPFVKF